MKILSSSFLSLPVTLIVAFITFRNIDPYYMGIWATMVIFETYATVFRIGIINGMNRELPFAMGQGKSDDAKKFAETTLAYSLFTILLILIIVPFIIKDFELNNYYFASIGIALGRVVLKYYSSYLGGTFRTSDNFNKLSNIQFAMLAVKLALSSLIFFYGFIGYLLMQILIAVINTALMHIYRPIKVKPRFDKGSFIHLLKIGFPIFLSSYAVLFIASIPRVFILKFGDETLLGLYTPVIMIVTTFSMLPNALSSYYYPKLSFLLGKEKNARLIWKKLSKIYWVSFIAIIPIAIAGFFIIDELITLFPKYSESLPYLKIGLFVGPFVIAKIGNLVSIVLKKVNFMSYYILFYAVFQVSYLFLFYFKVSKDVLFCAIWSQVLTFASLFITSIVLNFRAVKTYAAIE